MLLLVLSHPFFLKICAGDLPIFQYFEVVNKRLKFISRLFYSFSLRKTVVDYFRLLSRDSSLKSNNLVLFFLFSFLRKTTAVVVSFTIHYYIACRTGFFISDVNDEMDVGLHGWVSTHGVSVMHQKYTVHERALYFNSTFFSPNIFFSQFYFVHLRFICEAHAISSFIPKRKGACVDPLNCFQFCELKVYESKLPFVKAFALVFESRHTQKTLCQAPSCTLTAVSFLLSFSATLQGPMNPAEHAFVEAYVPTVNNSSFCLMCCVPLRNPSLSD